MRKGKEMDDHRKEIKIQIKEEAKPTSTPHTHKKKIIEPQIPLEIK